jgi:hypothetical protein
MSRAGDSIEDYCRACKLDRMHTVVAADPNGVPLRVACGYCSSEHNFRGGPRMDIGEDTRPSPVPRAVSQSSQPRAPRADREPFPLVSERERIGPVMSGSSAGDFEMLLRRVLREESGITPVAPAERWRGGTVILKPGNGSQEKSLPIETLFHKIVMIRNRLRSLEQQVNAMDIPDDVKVKLQSYITGSYGSLTSFNILFADQDDQFRGSSSD